MKYLPKKETKVNRLVLTGPSGNLIAIGGEVIRLAKPPVRPERVIPEATAKEYEWAYKNGLSNYIYTVKGKQESVGEADKKEEKQD